MKRAVLTRLSYIGLDSFTALVQTRGSIQYLPNTTAGIKARLNSILADAGVRRV